MNKIFFWTAAVLAAGMGAFPLHSAEMPVPRMQPPPKIDGKTEPGEWDSATVTQGFFTIGKNSAIDPRSGKVRIGYDDRNLYLCVQTELPPDGSKLRSTVLKNDSSGMVGSDDTVEIWAAHPRTDANQEFYQVIFNPRCTKYDVLHNPGKIPDETWSADWKTASGTDPKSGFWTLEVAIPLKSLGILKADGAAPRILVGRNWQRPWKQTPFIPFRKGGYDNPDHFMTLKLVPEMSPVQVTGFGKLQNQLFDLDVKIKNTGTAIRTYTAKLHFTHSDMPEWDLEKKMELAPGKEGTLAFHADGLHIHANASHKADLTVWEDGKEIYRSEYPWLLPMNYEGRWTGNTGNQSALDFCYYPTSGLFGVKLEAKGGDRAMITVHGKKEILRKETNIDPAKGILEESFQLPPLETGVYKLNVKIFRGQTLLKEFDREFNRTVFPWENNSIGITDKVYPPFKPLVCKEDSVTTVLNRYTFNSFGLFSQIAPEGKPILAAPMSYHYRTENGADQWKFTDSGFTEKKGNQVRFQAEATADGFRLDNISTMDYDGCTKVELTLSPLAGKTPEIRSFTLDIPLSNEQIRLLHVIKSNTIRSNPEIRIPQGTGVIWKSTDVSNGDFYGNMHIYLWMGEMERGLAWFADNDKNFHVDDKQPVQEIIRKRNELILRVHFINVPLKLTAPRTLVYGLQASPVKPMPSDWRNPKKEVPPHGGSGLYWGMRSSFSGKYPAGNDWSIADKMLEMRGRDNRTVQEETRKTEIVNFRDEWRKKYYGSIPADLWNKVYSPHIGGGMSSARNTGAKPILVYFEEHLQDQTYPEWDVFQDEWDTLPYSSRKNLSIQDLNADGILSTTGKLFTPVKSYQDFALWYGKKWMEHGFGLYCDNTFPHSSYDPVSSNAYRRSDGTIQPSAELWSLREYHKRMWTAARQVEETHPEYPLFIDLHITNGMLLPVVCWADIALDMEWGWNSGREPFPPEMLEIGSTARQIGAYPYPLYPPIGIELARSNVEKYKPFDWAVRMIFGMLRYYGTRLSSFAEYNKIVYDFGYGTDDCREWNYWRKDYPVRFSSPEVKSILLLKEREALLIMASWSKTPLKVTLSVDSALKVVSAQGLYPAVDVPVRNNRMEISLDGYSMQVLKLKLEKKQ